MIGGPEKTLDIIGLSVADQVTAMLAYWDNNQVCRFANSAYQEWFGKSPEEMVGKITLKELLGPLYEKNLPYINGALAGAKQIFEREIPLPGGGTRHTIATYFPDILHGRVNGFFVHVADVTPVKMLEMKLREQERSSKREILRSVIEVQEKEKELIADKLRDSVCQTLAYCKIMLQSAMNKDSHSDDLREITHYVHQAISELNELSTTLTPPLIAHFGIRQALEDYIRSFRTQYERPVILDCENVMIEELDSADKISVFRIIQDYLHLLLTDPACRDITINLWYTPPELVLRMRHNNVLFSIPKQNREYIDLHNRVAYYNGTIEKTLDTTECILLIRLDLRRESD